MPVTTSSAEVIYLTAPEDVELDDSPMSDREAIEVLHRTVDPLPTDVTDVDVTGDDAFGV